MDWAEFRDQMEKMMRLYKLSGAEITYITPARMRLRWASIQTVIDHCKHVEEQQRKVGGEAEQVEWMGVGEETNSETEDPEEGEAGGSVARTGQQAGHVIAVVKRVTFVESALSHGVVDGRGDRHTESLTKPEEE
ncbi:hypothetical protein DPEC_G00295840 [Dallia pectoralis]|uniref:Uncharacterized protein n=1 Tax=Dallia pectoralis TaxID=75939 RepID=A0ACC2FIV0_DALPE|nr:hypothetical protein DPEC_G00295840 [Dallia pectoralis]